MRSQQLADDVSRYVDGVSVSAYRENVAEKAYARFPRSGPARYRDGWLP